MVHRPLLVSGVCSYILSVFAETGLVQGQFGVWEIDGLYEDFTGMKSPEFLYGLVQSEDSQFISLQEVSRRICDSGAGEKFIIPQVLL